MNRLAISTNPAVATCSIFNTVLASVERRTAEIGILRAIGASTSQVIGIFLLEGIFVALVGATVSGVNRRKRFQSLDEIAKYFLQLREAAKHSKYDPDTLDSIESLYETAESKALEEFFKA